MVRHLRRYLEDREPSGSGVWALAAVIGAGWVLSMVMFGWEAFWHGLLVAAAGLALTAILFLVAHLIQRE